MSGVANIGAKNVSRETFSPALARYLLALAHGATHRAQVAAQLGVTRPSATKAVERLIELGLVREEPGTKRITLTTSGVSAAAQIEQLLKTVERSLVDVGVAPRCAREIAESGALAFRCECFT